MSLLLWPLPQLWTDFQNETNTIQHEIVEHSEYVTNYQQKLNLKGSVCIASRLILKRIFSLYFIQHWWITILINCSASSTTQYVQQLREREIYQLTCKELVVEKIWLVHILVNCRRVQIKVQQQAYNFLVLQTGL